MKIALACQSILLEKSLEIFLKDYIVAYKQCDFVISDKDIEMDKPLFRIGNKNSDLITPFSKSTLMLKVENFYDALHEQKDKKIDLNIDINELEDKITKLTDNFREDLVSVIKEYYDN